MQGDLFLLVNCGYDLDFRPHWEHLFPRASEENPYLVAPTLGVHPSFQTLAHCISSDIELYRFDINEDWRSGVRVMRRQRVN